MATRSPLRFLRPPDLTPDGALLRRFRDTGDRDALELVIRRHAPLVRRICRAVTRDPHLTDDAAQAVFLVLVRKAGSLTDTRSLAGWLARVAYRAATHARRESARRTELLDSDRPAGGIGPDEAATVSERAALVCREVARLPDRYHAPVILCYFQGLTHTEAAARLGWPAGTVAGRLARARDLLRDRLTRQGVTLPAAGLAGVLGGPTDLPAGFVPACVDRAATPIASELAREVLTAMSVVKRRVTAGCAVVMVGLTAVGGWAVSDPAPQPPAEKRAEPEKTRPERDMGLAAKKQFVFYGKVVDETGKMPLEGVEIWVASGAGTLVSVHAATTGKDGRFRAVSGPGLAVQGGTVEGQIAICRARKPGWYDWTYGWRCDYLLIDEPKPASERVDGRATLAPGESAPIEFRMAPAAAIRVKLVDGAGKPLAGAPVWLTGDKLYPASSMAAYGRTDPDGVWVANGIPRWSFRLVLGDKDDFHRELVVGQVNFTDAAEYRATVTVREWSRTGTDTDIGFKVARGPDLKP